MAASFNQPIVDQDLRGELVELTLHFGRASSHLEIDCEQVWKDVG